jgi:hypothetical protein
MDESFTLEKNFVFLLQNLLSQPDGDGQFSVIMVQCVLTQNTVAACVREYMETDACVATRAILRS